jgi:hypothetical protein
MIAKKYNTLHTHIIMHQRLQSILKLFILLVPDKIVKKKQTDDITLSELECKLLELLYNCLFRG